MPDDKKKSTMQQWLRDMAQKMFGIGPGSMPVIRGRKQLDELDEMERGVPRDEMPMDEENPDKQSRRKAGQKKLYMALMSDRPGRG